MDYKNNYGSISFEENKWDSRVLQSPAISINDIEYTSNCNLLIAQFIKDIMGDYSFATYRAISNDLTLFKALFQNQFIQVEKSFGISGSNFDTTKLSSLKKMSNIEEMSGENQETEVIQLAREEFAHGRFFEDPFIDNKTAIKRNENWIRDMINNDTRIVVLKKKDRIYGFMAYEEYESHLQLLLGGVRSTHRHLSYSFWANFISEYGNKKPIKTVISSSNLPIINLYAYFGFHFIESFTGFHFHKTR